MENPFDKYPVVNWYIIKKVLTHNEFQESHTDDENFIHFRKNRSDGDSRYPLDVQVPKLSPIPKMYLEGIISSSEIPEEYFLGQIEVMKTEENHKR